MMNSRKNKGVAGSTVVKRNYTNISGAGFLSLPAGSSTRSSMTGGVVPTTTMSMTNMSGGGAIASGDRPRRPQRLPKVEASQDRYAHKKHIFATQVAGVPIKPLA